MPKKLPFLFIPLALFLFSCSKPHVQYTREIKDNENHILPTTSIIDLLYHQHKNWKGTPYKNGGLNKRGIDCSGFVYVSYRDLFNQRLPRTTKQQKLVGRKVSLRKLHPGDLLFFKTGWYTHHVGIYLQNNHFLHASTNKGVAISSLNEEYWQDNLYLAKRIRIINQ